MAKKGKNTDKPRKITPKIQRFIDEYIIDCNGTQAAIRAGYSPKTANEQASRLLSKVNIRAEVDRRLKEISEKNGITAEKVINELALIGFSNITDFVNVTSRGVTVIDSSQIDPDKMKAVAEYSESQNGVKIKLHNKMRALEKLGERLGLWQPETEQETISTDKSEIRLLELPTKEQRESEE